MGSKLLSTDMLTALYLQPMIKAYTYHDYPSGANLLYQFNGFFKGFGFGIEDLPEPNNPDRTDIMQRRNQSQYYQSYFEKYAPLMSVELGKYQREVLDVIKEERGNY